MLIDKIPLLKWHAQITLSKDKYKEQQEMIDQIGLLLKGKYKVTASRFYELQPDAGIHIPESALPGTFHNIMGELNLSQIFENFTTDRPFLMVWKTRGFHPEYVAIAVSDLPGNNTLLGYFELEPNK